MNPYLLAAILTAIVINLHIFLHKLKNPYPQYSAVVEKMIFPSWYWNKDAWIALVNGHEVDTKITVAFFVGKDLYRRILPVSHCFFSSLSVGKKVRVEDRYGDYYVVETWSE